MAKRETIRNPSKKEAIGGQQWNAPRKKPLRGANRKILGTHVNFWRAAKGGV